MVECPNCNRIYNDNFDFCPYCETEKPAPKICPDCLLEPNLEYEFCPNCGTELEEKEEFIKNNLHKEKEWAKKAEELMGLDKEEALKYFNKLILLKPENDNYWRRRAYLLMDLEEYEEALKCYNKLIDQNPENIEYWIQKTKCLRILKKPLTIQDRELLEKYDIITIIEYEICRNYIVRPNNWEDGICHILYDMRYEIEIFDGYLTLLYMDNTQERFLLNLIDHHKKLVYCYSRVNSILKSYERHIEMIMEILDKYLTEYQNEEIHEIINQLKTLLKNKTNGLFCVMEYFKKKKYEYSESMMKNNNLYIMEKLFDEINDYIKNNELYKKFPFESIKQVQELLDNLKIFTDEEILELINDSLEASPSNKKILSLKGEYLSRLGKFEEALEIFNNNGLYYQQIKILKALERYDEAIDCYTFLIKEKTSFYKMKGHLKEKIELLKELERYDEALDVCEKYPFLKEEKIEVLEK